MFQQSGEVLGDIADSVFCLSVLAGNDVDAEALNPLAASGAASV
jgi:hypothetical protein